jgi:predicted transposase YbfD/YdcC
MLVIAVCAVMCEADGWEDIEEYGKAQAQWFAAVLDFPHGLPSHDTVRRVLSRLDPDALTQCLLSWTAALSDLSGGEIVAIDGQTRRHSFDRAAAKAALHLVSAWANRNRLVLGQSKVDDQSNDITALPQLLKLLDCTGATSTIDAMGCQKESAQVLTAPGADDGWALKKNHRTLYDDVTLFLDAARAKEFADIDQADHATVDGAQGRIEIRTYWLTSDIDGWGAKASWANVHSLGMVESRREHGEKVEIDRRYSLVSLPADGVRCSEAVRQPWGVENKVHWVLEVSFAEDASRIRQDQGAQTFSVLRHIALNRLRRESQHKRGIKARRKRAGWDRDYLLQVLTA